MYDLAAKERMLAGKKADPVENLPQGGTGKACDEVGKVFGISGKSVDRVYVHPRRVFLGCLERFLGNVKSGRKAYKTRGFQCFYVAV